MIECIIMYDGLQSLFQFHSFKELHSMRMNCYMIYWVSLENNTTALMLKIYRAPHAFYKYDVLQRAGLCEKTLLIL